MLQSIDPNTLCMGCMSTAATSSFCQECGWPQAKDNHTCQLPIRTILAGKYLVGRVLGQGGFGITYLGWDLNLDMKVAIKEYYPESLVSREQTGRTLVQCFAGESQQFFAAGRDKFVQEAKMLAKFDDLPGVVSVKDFFMENGTAYIVMKFIQGETLKKYIADEGRLPAADVLNRLYPLMVSLSQIHASGLIHRDISPDNIILEPDGGVKLLDFGAARSMSLTGEHSSTINVKKGYAPPEQYRVHGEQGPWTDVYALAATVYKAITGKTPPQSLDREVKDFLQRPTELGAELNWWQEAAILKGMSPKIEFRYPSVATFVADLYSAEAPAAMTQQQHDGVEQTPVQPPVQPPVVPPYSYNPSQQPQNVSYNPSQAAYIPVQQPARQGYSYNPGQQPQAQPGYSYDPSQQPQAQPGYSYNPSQQGGIPVSPYSYDPNLQNNGGAVPEPPKPVEKPKKEKAPKPPKPPKEPKPPKPPKEPKPAKQEDPFGEPKKKLGTGAIAGIIGGAAVAVILIVLLLVLPGRNKRPAGTVAPETSNVEQPADQVMEPSPYLIDSMSVFRGSEYREEWMAEAASVKSAMIHTEDSFTYPMIYDGLMAFKNKTGSECVEIVAAKEDLSIAIAEAVAWGANNIFLCDSEYRYQLFHLQQEYPEIKFVLYGATPMLRDDNVPPSENEVYIAPNTISLFFSEGQMGYLAGRLAVERGHTDLLYVGTNIWGVNGFLQGANSAAAEKGIDVAVAYEIIAFNDDEGMQEAFDGISEMLESGDLSAGLLFTDCTGAPNYEFVAADVANIFGMEFICTYPEAANYFGSYTDSGATACMQRNYDFSVALMLDMMTETRLYGEGEYGEKLYIGADMLAVDAFFPYYGMEEQREALNAVYDGLMSGDTDYLEARDHEIEDLSFPNLAITKFGY